MTGFPTAVPMAAVLAAAAALEILAALVEQATTDTGEEDLQDTEGMEARVVVVVLVAG